MSDANPIPILMIEDEKEIRKFLKLTLSAHGYAVIEARDGKEGLRLLATLRPELVILDLGLPDMDGLDIIKRMREWGDTPIIVLSARGRDQDKIEALESGADDYLTKPFSAGELLARIKVALRHARPAGGAQAFEHEQLKIDFSARAVTLDGQEVHLTPIEYKLLTLLVKNAGKVVTHAQLLKEIWSSKAPENNNYLRIHTQHLREKLRDDPLEPRYIITEPGIGYRFKSG